jgi:AcrR family transcriptional regulator
VTAGIDTHGRGGRLTQRERILDAMVEVAAERGYAGVSVKLLTTRAGVSSRTFYECFAGLEDCFLAVLDRGLERVSGLVAEAFAREVGWRDGVRTALASLLVFYDSEPQMARIWFIEALASGSWALERRERNVALLKTMIVEHWAIADEEGPEPLAVSGVIASVMGVIHTHLVTKQPQSLIELLGPLMGLVVTPYMDAAGVAREVGRGTQLTRAIQAGKCPWVPAQARVQGLSPGPPGPDLSRALDTPSAGRARECLRFLLGHPGSSNRAVAAGIDIAHQSQISRLLSQLTREGLVVKRSEGVGKRNAWRLTVRGEEIARALPEYGG